MKAFSLPEGTRQPPGQLPTMVVARLARRLASRVEADGAIRDSCGSRILESALLLSLLRKRQSYLAMQARLTEYLANAPAATFLDTAIAAAARRGYNWYRSGNGDDEGQTLTWLDTLHPFTGQRKRLLVATLLAVLDVAPYDPQVRPEQILYSGYATWTGMSLCAVKILHTAAQTGSYNEADTTWLTRRLADCPPGRIWEGNALAHLIALHALHASQPHHPAINEGTAALVAATRPDGGTPFVAGQEVWVTALAGTALALAGVHEPLLHRIGDYLTTRQQRDGGWGYSEFTTQTDVDDTSRCAVTLRGIGGRLSYRSSLERAREYLISMAGLDGGFPTYLKGDPAEADLTAGAVIALATAHAGDIGDHAALLKSATGFLAEAQRDDGSWEPSWTISTTSVTAHVIDALDAATRAVPALSTRTGPVASSARAYLAATQNDDGGWGHRPSDDSDVISTSHALPVVHSSLTAESGVAYLLEQQNHDGGYTAPPDQVGPRPLPYDFPALADVHVLTALARMDDPCGESSVRLL